MARRTWLNSKALARRPPGGAQVDPEGDGAPLPDRAARAVRDPHLRDHRSRGVHGPAALALRLRRYAHWHRDVPCFFPLVRRSSDARADDLSKPVLRDGKPAVCPVSDPSNPVPWYITLINCTDLAGAPTQSQSLPPSPAPASSPLPCPCPCPCRTNASFAFAAHVGHMHCSPLLSWPRSRASTHGRRLTLSSCSAYVTVFVHR